MTAGIDRQRANIGLDYAPINLHPSISVIGRVVDAASSADKVTSYENVAVGVDRQGTFIKRKKSIVDLLPTLRVVARSEHAKSVGTSKNQIRCISVRMADWARDWVSCNRPDLSRD